MSRRLAVQGTRTAIVDAAWGAAGVVEVLIHVGVLLGRHIEEGDMQRRGSSQERAGRLCRAKQSMPGMQGADGGTLCCRRALGVLLAQTLHSLCSWLASNGVTLLAFFVFPAQCRSMAAVDGRNTTRSCGDSLRSVVWVWRREVGLGVVGTWEGEISFSPFRRVSRFGWGVPLVAAFVRPVKEIGWRSREERRGVGGW